MLILYPDVQMPSAHGLGPSAADIPPVRPYEHETRYVFLFLLGWGTGNWWVACEALDGAMYEFVLTPLKAQKTWIQCRHMPLETNTTQKHNWGMIAVLWQLVHKHNVTRKCFWHTQSTTVERHIHTIRFNPRCTMGIVNYAHVSSNALLRLLVYRMRSRVRSLRRVHAPSTLLCLRELVAASC